MHEEHKWLVRKDGLANRAVERCRTRNPMDTLEEEEIGYEDACFILPGSLKARVIESAEEDKENGNFFSNSSL